ncbi:hypothetical protein FSC11_10140 [Acinetobacter schindleri]|nr:hypothetical protein FSC11_10140 [Acinetobacter schindleri]
MNKNNFHRYLTEVDLYIHSIEKIAASQAVLFVVFMYKLSLIKQSLTDNCIIIKKDRKSSKLIDTDQGFYYIEKRKE